ncbi:MAG: DinB family protein [Anaerolineaceae bacterium]
MTEKTAADILTEIETAHTGYMSELKQAGGSWETKPAAGEGEDAWSARQVAEHIAGSNLFFGAGIAEAIGLAAPGRERLSLVSAADATAKTAETHATFAGVAAKVSDNQLAMEIDHPRLGKQTLGGILSIVTHHYNDHANQLKTLRG